MTVPSSMNMKFKFPEFTDIADTSIEFAIEEAVVANDGKAIANGGEWISDAEQTLAVMYYAAHLMQMSIMRAASGTGQIITSDRIGELSISYGGSANPGGPSDFKMTTYGTKYLDIVRRNFPAVLTVNSAVRM
jgi:hypothetical protein